MHYRLASGARWRVEKYREQFEENSTLLAVKNTITRFI